MEKKRNLWVIPTDKPSRLYLFEERLILGDLVTVIFKNSGAVNQNIYITSDEEIKEGDWILFQGILTKALEGEKFSGKEKIILTTDQGLIKDGIQAVDDEFLEWFVKNPSCEFVEVINEQYTQNLHRDIWYNRYKIIIPKEEPKQEYEYIGECKGNNDDGCFMNSSGHNCGCYTRKPIKQETTLEEFANKAYPFYGDVELREAIELGANWQQEQDKNKYSEEEVKHIVSEALQSSLVKFDLEQWFKQFKKK